MSNPHRADNVRLVILRPSDEPALRALFADNDLPQITRFFDPFPLDDATARRLCHYEGRDRHWGIWAGEDLTGLIMVRGWDGGHPDMALGIMLDHRIRGEGVATAAMHLCAEEVRALGATRIRARIHEENAASRALGKRCGYREIEHSAGRVLIELSLTAD